MLWILDLNVMLGKDLDKCPLCGHDIYRVAENPNTYKCYYCGLMAIDNFSVKNGVEVEELRVKFGPNWVTSK